MGRDWLNKIKVNFWEIHSLTNQHPLEELLEKHSVVFKEKLGCLQGVKAQLLVDDTYPKFHKPRTVPFVFKEKVEAELDRLQSLGIISLVQFSRWAASIVPVVNPDGSVRICGDFKVTINQVSQVESYPLPRVEELFATLSGGKQFSKLDLAQAYLQLPFAEDSKEFVTINTSKGLFQYNRLPFGVSSAPAIFQRCIENLLQGCKGVSIYIDDILVMGKSIEEYLHNLEEGIEQTRISRFTYDLTSQSVTSCILPVEYLGHIIDAVAYTQPMKR